MVEWRRWRGLALHPMRPRQGRPSPPRDLDGYGPFGLGGLQPDGAETPPRREPWSHGEAVEKILEAIPCDRWVSAAEIAAETGIDSRKVGALIGLRLLNVYVEWRPTRPSGGGRHLYRRLRYMDTSRRTPDS